MGVVVGGGEGLRPPGPDRVWEELARHARSSYLRYSFTRGTAQETAFLVAELGLRPGDVVVDVGCGPGRHVAALAAAGMTAAGVDLAEAFLAEAARGAGLYVRGDARRPPLADGCAQAVVSLCQGGFGLLGGGDDAEALAAMARLLRPGGRLAVTAFSAYFAVRHLEPEETFDADEGVLAEVASVVSPGGEDRQFPLRSACFTPRELRLAAAAAGLEDAAVYSCDPGAFSRRPPDLEARQFLLVARAPCGSSL
ncbi:MAG TPA: methyltransferase domain-containing protein [Acidimicrobiales bacterium]|nr:methyltransferase domain-containing protein [Acidimicrobiales bacterium]